MCRIARLASVTLYQNVQPTPAIHIIMTAQKYNGELTAKINKPSHDGETAKKDLPHTPHRNKSSLRLLTKCRLKIQQANLYETDRHVCDARAWSSYVFITSLRRYKG